MRIFLAGGTGVVGRALIPRLIARGHTVTATTRHLDRFSLLAALGAIPAAMDALDPETAARALADARPDVVIHQLTDLTAGDVGANATLRSTGTRTVVDAARRAGVSRLIAQSISWVYAPGQGVATEADPLDLDSTTRKVTVDGVVALEQAVRDVDEWVVLRYGTLYGPGTWYSRTGKFGLAAREGRLPATGAISCFLHVEDAAAAALAALDWPRGVVNIVDDHPAAGTEWIPEFARAVGAPAPTVGDTATTGRPVSNALAHQRGLELRHPDWQYGFRTL